MDSLPTPVNKRHQSNDINERSDKSPKYFLPLKSERNPSRRNSIEDVATPSSRQIGEKQAQRQNSKNPTFTLASANKKATGRRSPNQVKAPLFKTDERGYTEKGFIFPSMSQSSKFDKLNFVKNLQIETEALDRSRSHSHAHSPKSCQNNQSEKVFTPYSAKARRNKEIHFSQDGKGSLFKKYYKQNMVTLKKDKESFWERSKAKSLVEDIGQYTPNSFTYSKQLYNAKVGKHTFISDKKEPAVITKHQNHSSSKGGSTFNVPSISLSGITTQNDGGHSEARTPVRSRGEIDSRSNFKLTRRDSDC